jgi:hypothetical protein
MRSSLSMILTLKFVVTPQDKKVCDEIVVCVVALSAPAPPGDKASLFGNKRAFANVYPPSTASRNINHPTQYHSTITIWPMAVATLKMVCMVSAV